jgi:hypothetical protein
MSNGTAIIACTLKGNSAVNGYTIVLTRMDIGNNNMEWICDSDFDEEAKVKYAGKCNPNQ